MRWKDLEQHIANMSELEKCNPVQVALPGPDLDKAVELMPGIAFGTVGSFEFEKCRSVADNKYHRDEPVLLIDHNPFDEDGAIAFRLEGDDYIPVYGKHGKTDPEQQEATQSPKDLDMPSHVFETTLNRIQTIDSRQD